MPDNAKPARIYRLRRIRNSRLLNGGNHTETNGAENNGNGAKGLVRKRVRRAA